MIASRESGLGLAVLRYLQHSSLRDLGSKDATRRGFDHGKSRSEPSMTNKLYIANVPFDTTEDALRRHFAACGGVLHIDLPDESQRGKMRGIACVTMTSPAFEAAALAKLDGVSFAGRVLRVSEFPPSVKNAPKPAVTIVLQFRERSTMVYDLDCDGLPLVVRVFREEPDHWRIEARANDALDARIVSARATTRAGALNDIIREWNENAATIARGRSLDGDALARALKSVRAI